MDSKHKKIFSFAHSLHHVPIQTNLTCLYFSNLATQSNRFCGESLVIPAWLNRTYVWFFETYWVSIHRLCGLSLRVAVDLKHSNFPICMLLSLPRLNLDESRREKRITSVREYSSQWALGNDRMRHEAGTDSQTCI